MNRSLKIISDIPSNKVGIQLFADAVVDGLMSGEVDPLDVRAKIDAIEKIIKAIKANEQFADVVLDAADMEPDKTFEHNGVKFTKANAVRFDYSVDPTWKKLKAAETECSNARKDWEATLKTLKEPTLIEDVEAMPPIKSSSTTVRVTF
jgi:hypothetical protein